MFNDTKRYYATLDVEPTASDEAVRIAFRRLAKTLHPDAPSGDAAGFIRLKRAYDVLGDPSRRADYDRAGSVTLDPRPPPRRAERPTPARSRPFARSKTPRRNGMGWARYVIAFVVMAAISLGGVQAMISLTEAPPSVQLRATPAGTGAAAPADPAPAAEAASPPAPMAPGSSKSGFWDATPAPAPGRAKTP